MDSKEYISIIKEKTIEFTSLQKKISEELASFPDGTLNLRKTKAGKIEYYHYKGNRQRNYIPKSQMKLAHALAQKKYDEKVLDLLEKHINSTNAYLEALSTTEECIYNDLAPERKALVSQLFPTDEEYLKTWYEKNPGSQNPIVPSNISHTDRGEIVRSKSEKMIADLFFKYKIPYVYEPEIRLKDGHHVCPDFLLLNVRLRKTYVYEHFGTMDDAGYAVKTTNKIIRYQKNGFWPGQNFLFSMETNKNILDTRLVEKMIHKYLL